MISNVAASLKPIVSKEFQTFLGKQNLVSAKIAETPVTVIDGTIPVNLSNIAFDIANDTTGLAISSAIRTMPIPDGVQFTTKENKITIGIPSEYFDRLSVFASNDKGMLTKATTYLGQQLANRAGLIRENELASLVQSRDYNAANTIDLTAKPVSTWTVAEFEELASALATAMHYINRAVGFSLIDGEQKIDASNYTLHNVIPVSLWQTLIGKWGVFKDYVTYQGLGGSDYKRLETGIFDYILYGATTSVAMAEKVADNAATDGKFLSGQMVPLWKFDDANECSIYLFASSANDMNPSSVKDIVFRKDDLITTNFLDDQYYRATVRRSVVSTNDYAYFKIDLKLK